MRKIKYSELNGSKLSQNLICSTVMRIQVTVFWVVTLCNDVVSYHDLEFQMFITKWKIYVLTTYLWLSYTTESTAFLFSYFFCSLYLWP